MRRRRRDDPHLHVPLATYGAPDRPAPVDEIPVPADVLSQPFKVDITPRDPPSSGAGGAPQEGAHPVLDQLAERVYRDGIGGVAHAGSGGRWGGLGGARLPHDHLWTRLGCSAASSEQ